MLEDLASLTGGKVIGQDHRVTIQGVRLEDLGRAKRVIMDGAHATIVDINGRLSTFESLGTQMARTRSTDVALS